MQKTNQVRCPRKYACDDRLSCAKINFTVKETVIKFALHLSKVWLVSIFKVKISSFRSKAIIITQTTCFSVRQPTVRCSLGHHVLADILGQLAFSIVFSKHVKTCLKNDKNCRIKVN